MVGRSRNAVVICSAAINECPARCGWLVMAFAAQGVGSFHEGASMIALSPFSRFAKLQHTCDLRFRPAVDQCRRRLIARQAQTGPGCKHQKLGVQAHDPCHCSRRFTTACRAQTTVADPAVTGQPQQEASPGANGKQLPTKSSAYPFEQLEAKWQDYWLRHKTFRTPGIQELDKSKPKFYALDMFPYPRCGSWLVGLHPSNSGVIHPFFACSGSGLHVGHPEGYTATDIMARYKRMTGHNVLHPMGWDAFGLPAETYAIQTGTHPADTTARNIDRFRQQLQALGFSYDWDRELATTDPSFYK